VVGQPETRNFLPSAVKTQLDSRIRTQETGLDRCPPTFLCTDDGGPADKNSL